MTISAAVGYPTSCDRSRMLAMRSAPLFPFGFRTQSDRYFLPLRLCVRCVRNPTEGLGKGT